jgi:hypothetical protein
MNMTAEIPLTLASFLDILVLMAFSRGMRSVSTKFCANDVTSTPEPALKEERIFCAEAFLEASNCAAVMELAVEVAPDVVLLELTGVVAIRFLRVYRQCDRIQQQKLEPIN